MKKNLLNRAKKFFLMELGNSNEEFIKQLKKMNLIETLDERDRITRSFDKGPENMENFCIEVPTILN